MIIGKKENISTFNVGMNSVLGINTINTGAINNTIHINNAMDDEERGSSITAFIGVDVSKYFIDVYCSLNGRYYEHITNNEISIKSLIDNDLKKIRGLNPLNTLVVIDLTGNYEVLCRDIFYHNNFINIHLAEGRKINYFKRSKKNNMAKTDRVDSFILSLYGKENLYTLKFYGTNCNTKDLSNLKAIQNRLEELKQLLVQEKNRYQAPDLNDFVKKDLSLSLKQLEKRIDKLEKESMAIVNNNRELKRKYDILVSQRGIGAITANILIAFLPELGTVNKRQIASITGVAPICKDSGISLRGYRTTRGTGRRILKKTLFIIILSHLRDKDSVLDKFYNKLLKGGKLKKIAIVACMRKFIIYLNSTLKKEIENNPLGEETMKNIGEKEIINDYPLEKDLTNRNIIKTITSSKTKTINTYINKEQTNNNTTEVKTYKHNSNMKHYA